MIEDTNDITDSDEVELLRFHDRIVLILFGIAVVALCSIIF